MYIPTCTGYVWFNWLFNIDMIFCAANCVTTDMLIQTWNMKNMCHVEENTLCTFTQDNLVCNSGMYIVDEHKNGIAQSGIKSSAFRISDANYHKAQGPLQLCPKTWDSIKLKVYSCILSNTCTKIVHVFYKKISWSNQEDYR